MKESIIQEKVLPHDTDTETAVLATLMRYNDKFDEYADILNADIFYYSKEKALYRCLEGVIKSGGITDVNSMLYYAYGHDVGYSLELHDFVNIINAVSRQTLGQDIMRLVDMAKRRAFWLSAQKFSQKVLDFTTDADDEDTAMRKENDKTRQMSMSKETDDFVDALKDLDAIVEDNDKGISGCLKTGFRLFDDYYLLRPSTLTVIAAFTSVGKSSLAQNIVMNVARQGIPSAYYSLEMSKAELAARGISKAVGLPASVIMNKRLEEKWRQRYNEVVARVKNLPIYFDDRSTVSFDRTMRSIRTMVKKKGIKLAVIDYLQIYNQVIDTEEQTMAYMARTAKNVAIETGISIIVLSQLSRSGDHPTIKMLRGSGQIEESADNIVLIDRPDAYPDNKVTSYQGEFKDVSVKGTAKLILAKGRGVGVSSCIVGFEGKHTRFFEIEKPDDDKFREHKEEMPF